MEQEHPAETKIPKRLPYSLKYAHRDLTREQLHSGCKVKRENAHRVKGLSRAVHGDRNHGTIQEKIRG